MILQLMKLATLDSHLHPIHLKIDSHQSLASSLESFLELVQRVWKHHFLCQQRSPLIPMEVLRKDLIVL